MGKKKKHLGWAFFFDHIFWLGSNQILFCSALAIEIIRFQDLMNKLTKQIGVIAAQKPLAVKIGRKQFILNMIREVLQYTLLIWMCIICSLIICYKTHWKITIAPYDLEIWWYLSFNSLPGNNFKKKEIRVKSWMECKWRSKLRDLLLD